MIKEAENNPVLKLLIEYFDEVYKGDQQKVSGALTVIGQQVQQEGCKLIHFGNVVFLVHVTGSHMVEFHAMVGGKLSEKEKVAEIDKELDKLLPMLKRLGVLIAYTTMPKDKVKTFARVLDNYKFTKRDVQLHNGQKGVAFYVTLEK